MKLKKLIAATAIVFTSFTAMADSDDALTAFAMQNASFTLDQAVAKMDTNYPGIITEFEMDDHKGQAVYEIESINLKKEEKSKIKLSAVDGAVTKEKVKSLSTLGVSHLDDDELLALQMVTKSNFSLQTTINNIRAKYKAQIIEFELENEKGITFYKFKLIGEMGRKYVIVDVKTGKMLPVANH